MPDAPRSRRRRFVGPPPQAHAIAGWSNLALRGFLGFTFCFAGLQKLANPNFFNANSGSSIQAQLIGSDHTSPLHLLLGHLLRFATPIGVFIAVAELAVGLGALFGLWTRIAAIGGMLLSLTLFLTVSFHSSPWYTGADIVFLFAWTPLLIGGSGGVLSIDAAIAARAGREAGAGPTAMVPVRFSTIQQVCGHFDDGRCDARAGADCAVHGCPFLAGRPAVREALAPDPSRRRVLVLGGTAAAALGVVGAAVAGADAALGRIVDASPAPPNSQTATLSAPTTSGRSTTTVPTTTASSSPEGTTESTTTTTEPHPAGTAVGEASQVAVGGSAHFTDPYTGNPTLVIRKSSDVFNAFDAVCPHAGCTVNYSSAADLIVCPCHGSEFDPDNGSLVQGPAKRGLDRVPITKASNGELYVTS